MDRDKAARIIAEQLPNHELVEEVEAAQADATEAARAPLGGWSKFGANAAPTSDAKKAKMDRLRERFLGSRGPGERALRSAPVADSSNSGMVLVKPKGSNAPAKAVIIENGKIVSRQG